MSNATEEAVARGEVPTGPCWVCGTPATNQCDYRYDPGYKCNRWICFDHAVVAAQRWDTRGWDGVDVRCHEHRNWSLGVRTVFRGRELPPAPRWEGTELLTAY